MRVRRSEGGGVSGQTPFLSGFSLLPSEPSSSRKTPAAQNLIQRIDDDVRSRCGGRSKGHASVGLREKQSSCEERNRGKRGSSRTWPGLTMRRDDESW
jgi:hypothetical protein